MPTVAVFDMTGKKTGEMELNAAVFGIEPNMTVVHAAVTSCTKYRTRHLIEITLKYTLSSCYTFTFSV